MVEDRTDRTDRTNRRNGTNGTNGTNASCIPGELEAGRFSRQRTEQLAKSEKKNACAAQLRLVRYARIRALTGGTECLRGRGDMALRGEPGLACGGVRGRCRGVAGGAAWPGISSLAMRPVAAA